MNLNFLSILILIFSPAIVAGLLLSPVFPNNEIKIRRFSKTFAIAHFVYSMLFLLFFNPTNYGWSYQKELTFFNGSWLKSLGITATFGVDGISLVFVLLTSFLIMLVTIISKSMIRTKHRIYYPLVFILQTAFLGVFCAKDVFLFFLFWELELIPMYLLISQWGDRTSPAAAMKYVVYSFLGSVFMLLGLLVLYFYSFSISGVLTADIESLSMSENVFAMWFQSFIFFCLLIGFVVKLPLVPLHNWLSVAGVEAVTPVSMVMSGILPALGGYGIIRFNLELFPEVFSWVAYLLVAFGVLNILYGACIALVQTDIKKITAYLVISASGLALVGLGAMSEVAFNGAILQLVVGGIVAAGLFGLVGIVTLRTKTREISALGGLSQIMPVCMYLGLIICLGAMGTPLFGGFPAKFAILSGLFVSELEPQSFVIICILLVLLGLILVVGCVLYAFHKIFFGPVLSQFKTDSIQYDADGNEIAVIYPKRGITKSEIIVLGFIALAIILFGVFPNAVFDVFQFASDVILDFMKV